MAEDPELTIPDVPLTVVARVYAKGDPLGGNICPPVSVAPDLLDTHASTNFSEPLPVMETDWAQPIVLPATADKSC